MEPMSVPIIDIAPFLDGTPAGKRKVAEAVGRACEQIGFLTLTGHGLAATLITQMSAAARLFFDLPLEEKMKLKLTPAGVGYSPLGGETLAASLGHSTPADLKESLNLGAQFEQNLWPEQLPELKSTAIAYFQAMAALAAALMRIFALALDLPEHYFEDKIDRHNSFLRVINYPAQAADPLPGQLRAGAHSDYGTLTILLSENSPGGLQVRNRQDKWVDVQTVSDSFVVNLGDLMMRWTNDRWVSTLHRVVNPPSDKRGVSRRQSLVFFHNPNPDAIIACLESCSGPGQPAKYPPVSAGDYLSLKSRQAYDVPQL